MPHSAGGGGMFSELDSPGRKKKRKFLHLRCLLIRWGVVRKSRFRVGIKN